MSNWKDYFANYALPEEPHNSLRLREFKSLGTRIIKNTGHAFEGEFSILPELPKSLKMRQELSVSFISEGLIDADVRACVDDAASLYMLLSNLTHQPNQLPVRPEITFNAEEKLDSYMNVNWMLCSDCFPVILLAIRFFAGYENSNVEMSIMCGDEIEKLMSGELTQPEFYDVCMDHEADFEGPTLEELKKAIFDVYEQEARLRREEMGVIKDAWNDFPNWNQFPSLLTPKALGLRVIDGGLQP